MTAYNSLPEDVARLICGSVEDLKSSLHHESNADLIERALAAAHRLREGKTKQKMLERHLAKLRKAQTT